ncbi:MAG: RHS repeat-associated core domain-containing protein, partial [Thermoanaerobaculum sp.]
MRFLSPDPLRGDPRSPQSLNLFAYVKGNPLNFVDPDGREVKVVTVTYRPDLDKLLKQLEAKTGYKLGVVNGKIVILGDLLKEGKVLRSEVSGIARALIAEMINSSETFRLDLVRGDKETRGASTPVGGYRITMDVADLESAQFFGVPRESFDLGMAFLHEAGHTAIRGFIDTEYLRWFTHPEPGQVEALLINPIRNKLNLGPQRTQYEGEITQRGGNEVIKVKFAGNNYVEYINF